MPPLQSVAWQMVETLHLAQLLGEARMDSLLLEMLLGEGAKTENGLCTGRGHCCSIHLQGCIVPFAHWLSPFNICLFQILLPLQKTRLKAKKERHLQISHLPPLSPQHVSVHKFTSQ